MEAGREALKFFRNDVQVWWKNGGTSPVTAADHAANDILLDRLLRRARRITAGCRRRARTIRARLGRDRVFIVDPIDGTRAFMEGKRHLGACSAARDRSTAGQPACSMRRSLDELYVADAVEAGSRRTACRCSITPGIDRPMRHQCRRRHDAGASVPGLGEIERHVAHPSLAYRLAMIADGRLDATHRQAQCA